MALTGGCQCGAVRYRLDGEPVGSNICHCRMCQKAGGAPFMAFAGAALADFVWTRGAPKVFASSDIAERGFCAECGTPLTYRPLGRDRIAVTIGSLDHAGEVAPVKQFALESRLAWLETILDLPARDFTVALAPEFRIASHQHPDHDT
jgi:hypothetical protein